jgi:hypothetical protein
MAASHPVIAIPLADRAMKSSATPKGDGCKSCKKPHKESMKNAQRTPQRLAITLRLDPVKFKKLEMLARAENRTPTNYVETVVLRDLEAREEAGRVITMFVPQDASDITPGVLLRAEGESDERYAERSLLMDKLFAIPDTD